MRNYALSHLSDAVLLRDLVSLVARDCDTTAELLAHLAEVDARKLYVPAGYPSMFSYCVGKLRFSEDAAYKRIQAARAGRQFPALFVAIAEGRLHLTATGLLAPHLTAETVDELIEVATHRSKSEIEGLLASRLSPRPVLTKIPLVASIRPVPQLAPAQVQNDGGLFSSDGIPEIPEPCELAPAQVASGDEPQVPAPVPDRNGQLAPAQVASGTPKEPSFAQNMSEGTEYLVRLKISGSTHEKLRRAQVLLSHTVPAGDVAQVLDRALDSLLKQLEKRKLGAVSRRSPQPHPVAAQNRSRPRYVPPHVRRTVWERDAGQCTFVSASGHRCTERRFLEFDHIEPVARGSKATVLGMRLRCRAHNQFEAERVFGVDFKEGKRLAARRASAATASSARPGGSTGEAHPRPAWGRARSRSASHEAPSRRTESTGRSPRQP